MLGSSPPAARLALSRLVLFESLEPGELERIAAAVRPITIARGSHLFRRGDACNGFHIVLRGQIKLAVRAPNGTEKVIEVLDARESFGEAVMFLERPYPVDAQALADTELLFVPREVIFGALDADPRVARRMLGAMSARLHRLVSDVEAYSLQSGRQRVIGYMLSLVAESDGAASITLKTSKGVLASRLNLTQEHFSRILRELSEAGAILVRGRTIVVSDPASLRAMANGE